MKLYSFTKEKRVRNIEAKSDKSKYLKKKVRSSEARGLRERYSKEMWEIGGLAGYAASLWKVQLQVRGQQGIVWKERRNASVFSLGLWIRHTRETWTRRGTGRERERKDRAGGVASFQLRYLQWACEPRHIDFEPSPLPRILTPLAHTYTSVHARARIILSSFGKCKFAKTRASKKEDVPRAGKLKRTYKIHFQLSFWRPFFWKWQKSLNSLVRDVYNRYMLFHLTYKWQNQVSKANVSKSQINYIFCESQN